MAAETLYANGGTIHSLLREGLGMRAVRRRLSAEVAGLGPKQASLFLRNVGYAINIAVLDGHVLTYMKWIGLTPLSLKTVRTVSQYEILEEAFIKHSFSAGFRPDLYDMAVWLVTRTAKREYAPCLL
jgi:N-glycosylase/DNA lyase